MDIFAWIAGIASFVSAVVIDIWDMRTSLYYPLHETGEKTKWFRNAEGYFSLKRGVIISLIVAVACWIPVYWTGPWWLVLIFSIVAFGQGIQVWKNAREQREDRAEQERKLGLIWLGQFTFPPTSQFKGSWVIRPFFDIRVAADSPDPRAELIRKLETLAAKAKSEWWKLDRAKSL